MSGLKRLKNGIFVYLFEMDYSPSVSIGYYIKAGTLYEKEYSNGISHMIEHMLFKGTDSMNSFDIARKIDHIGGEINAYTSKECTGIYSKVLPEDIEIPIKVISDMIMNSKFDIQEIEKEKSVIKEEIKSYEDSPDEINYDLLSEVIYKDTDLIYTILGTESSVDAITKEEIMKYIDEFYIPQNIVISIAGKFNPNQVMKLLNDSIGKLTKKDNNHLMDIKTIENKAGFSYKYKNFEQTHIDFAFWGPNVNDPLYYAAHLINNIIAGTMSSRMFQKIREEYGLVYSIYSQISSYEITGNLTISMSLSELNIKKASKEVIKELIHLKNNSITIEEFICSKKQITGNMKLNTESSDAYMNLISKDLLYNRKIKNISEVISEIEAITYEDAKIALERILNSKKAVSAVGKINKSNIIEIYDEIILNLED